MPALLVTDSRRAASGRHRARRGTPLPASVCAGPPAAPRGAWARPALAFVLFAGAALRLLAIRLTPADRSSPPLMDDAFYYFSLGRSLAAGRGFRVDPSHLTTGFQPLWGILNAVPYWIAPRAPIACAQGMGVVVGLLTGLALDALVRRLSGSAAAGVAAALLWSLSPAAIAMSVSGMDTGLAVLGALVVLWAARRAFERPSRASVAAAGLACGGAALARVDLLMLAAAVAPALVVLAPRRERVRSAALFALCCGAPLVPWIALTLSMGKGPVPESGAAVRLIASLTEGPDAGLGAILRREVPRFAARAASDLDLLLPADPAMVRDVAADSLTAAAGLAALLLAALVVLARTRVERALLGVWSLFAAQMTIGYAGFVGAEWFYERYARPLADTFAALVIALLGARIASAAPAARRRLALAASAYVALTIVFFALLVVYANRYHWLSGARLPADSYVETSRWLDARLSPGDRVGAFQSGLIGYRSARTVVNLDGKVNAEARRAMAEGRMWDYVCAAGIDYVADWPFLIDRLLVRRSAGWREDNLELVATIPRGDGNSDWAVERVRRENCGVPGPR